MTVERGVVDTSVLISAMLLPGGGPTAVVDQIVDRARFVFSEPTFEEFATRILRPKFDRYLLPGDRDRFLRKLSEAALWTTITGTLQACRDPHDDKFLETAVPGRADCIVSGDQDVLVLHPFQGIPILTPAAFLLRFVGG